MDAPPLRGRSRNFEVRADVGRQADRRGIHSSVIAVVQTGAALCIAAHDVYGASATRHGVATGP